MNKITRNTIIVSSLWVLILIIGMVYIYGHQEKILKKLKAEEKQKSERLADLRALMNDLTELQNYYEKLKENSLRFKGTLASFVSPGETFDYIRRELLRTNSTIKLDMDFESESPFKNMIKRNYILKGTGKFVDIYRFLWFLENGPVFYNLSSLTIDNVDPQELADNILLDPNDEATFNFTLIGYDRKEGPKITEINNEYGEPKLIANIFEEIAPLKRPVKRASSQNFAKGEAQPPKPTNFFRRVSAPPTRQASAKSNITSNYEILAITPFSVLLKDATGKTIKVRKGEKFNGGTLASLDAKAGTAVIQYDSQSGARKVVLTMKK